MMDKLDYSLLPVDENRSRMGLTFLVAGILLVLWACGNWMYRASGSAEIESNINNIDESSLSLQDDLKPTIQPEVAKALPMFLMVGFILVLVFLIVSFIWVRSARRYRTGLSRKRPPPTDTRDVWSMHKVPHDNDYDD